MELETFSTALELLQRWQHWECGYKPSAYPEIPTLTLKNACAHSTTTYGVERSAKEWWQTMTLTLPSKLLQENWKHRSDSVWALATENLLATYLRVCHSLLGLGTFCSGFCSGWKSSCCLSEGLMFSSYKVRGEPHPCIWLIVIANMCANRPFGLIWSWWLWMPVLLLKLLRGSGGFGSGDPSIHLSITAMTMQLFLKRRSLMRVNVC